MDARTGRAVFGLKRFRGGHRATRNRAVWAAGSTQPQPPRTIRGCCGGSASERHGHAREI